MCMFAFTVSIVEPKNIKEAMADSAWIEAMLEELHQFDRLQVWELVDKPFGKNVIKLKWLWKNKKDEDQTIGQNVVLHWQTHYRQYRIVPVLMAQNQFLSLHWEPLRTSDPTNPYRSYALSWKPCQGDSLNLPDHRIHKDGDGDAIFHLKSDSLPHAYGQTTKTYYKHRDSRIMKAQELKTKTSAQTLIYKIFLQRYQVYQGRLLASFQDDAKYEHVGQDTRSQGGKDERIKI
ncbi:hypothetical protein Tco_0760005 [Tanacetum coccineum]